MTKKAENKANILKAGLTAYPNALKSYCKLEVTEDKPAEPEFLEESDILKTEADIVDLSETTSESVSSSEFENSVTDEKTEEEKEVEEDDTVFEKYDRLKVELALASALKNPRVAAWSPTSAMILNYFKSTRPRSDKSLSSEIDEILAEGLINRYPELYQAFQIVINENNSLEITNLKGIKKETGLRSISEQ